MYLAGIILLLGTVCSALLLHLRLRRIHAEAQGKLLNTGFTGAEFARSLLLSSGLSDIKVELTDGYFGDHYDPQDRTVRLSQEVYFGKHLSAHAIAAHEVAHAQQDDERFAPLRITAMVLPFFSVCSALAWLSLLIGVLQVNTPLISISAVLLLVLLFCKLFYLPVEYNANTRARRLLSQLGQLSDADSKEVGKLLSATAHSYLGGVPASVLAALKPAS